MHLLASSNPTGSEMTFVFPIVLFAGVALWAFFQYSRR
ncbi:MAG: hypothetical protein QOG80_3254 [Pseudonocardiales bacterium]|jgi:hypothetical protein|nr:hypothetical protein [Pseudonocardiales bacterium]